MNVPRQLANGSSGLVLVGDAADEGDIARDLVAVDARVQIEPRRGGAQVVDAQVDGGDRRSTSSAQATARPEA